MEGPAYDTVARTVEQFEHGDQVHKAREVADVRAEDHRRSIAGSKAFGILRCLRHMPVAQVWAVWVASQKCFCVCAFKCIGRPFPQASPLCTKVQIYSVLFKHWCIARRPEKQITFSCDYADGNSSSRRPSQRGPKVRSFPFYRINDRVSRVIQWCRILRRSVGMFLCLTL